MSRKSIVNLHKFACHQVMGPRSSIRHLSSISSDFDFIIVGAGSTGAVLANRLSKDPNNRVLLLEAGSTPPPESAVPILYQNLQNTTGDWQYTGDPGQYGTSLRDGRMFVPQGKMLGGSSSINYMAYVRGHPGDFDSWADQGNKEWGDEDVLPYFKKSENLDISSSEVVIDECAHGFDGSLSISVRDPPLPVASAFVNAAVEKGYPKIDYNGRDRGGPEGGVSFFQNTIQNGTRSSTYTAFLEPIMGIRSNLTVITDAHATRILLDTEGILPTATGVEYVVNGIVETAKADKEVIVSAGAIGSPQLLMLSGIGPKDELKDKDVPCILDSPCVGKHLKDHLQLGLIFPTHNGESNSDILDSVGMLPESNDTKWKEYQSTGRGLPETSLYESAIWYNTGIIPEHEHTHDAQISFMTTAGASPDDWTNYLRTDANDYFGDELEKIMSLVSKSCMFLGNPVQPKSKGEILLRDSDPMSHPDIYFNYLSDPDDMPVFVAVCKEAFAISQQSAFKDILGDLFIPKTIAERHGTNTSADGFWEEWIKKYAWSVSHPTSTCRMGDVVDSECRVLGVPGLRVADASIMPNIISGNTNASCIMIGEKAADMIAKEHSQ